jgi:septal ring factor EnvC (AmiA/AmiB activator)
MKVENGIWCGSIVTSSDQRIKDITGVSNSKNDLSILSTIKVTDYKMKDKAIYGQKTTKKVIAQQLKSVYPQAVSLQTDVIPDIYKISEIKEGYIKLETELKKGDKVKLIFEDNEEVVEVLSTDKNGFTVNNKNEGKVFVFGKQVDDFHVVDYDAVSMLNVSATQELYKLILKQQKTIEKQKTQISAQIEESKKTQSNFDERIKNLEILFNISKLNE